MESRIVVCVVEQSQPFICEVYGKFTVDALEQIEKELPETIRDGKHAPDIATVEFTAEWIRGDSEVPGYWDMVRTGKFETWADVQAKDCAEKA